MIVLKITIELLKSFLLDDFPSGSSINYSNEKFYLIGDDATHVLVLDKNYSKIDSIDLFEHPEKRIAKSEKADLESSTIVEIKGVKYLLAFGSASRENRERVVIIPISGSIQKINTVNTHDFSTRIKSQGIAEINLEGACMLNERLVLGNRGNLAAPKNQLIVTSKDFWQFQNNAEFSFVDLDIPGSDTDVLGLSELCYVASKDILLITLTSEATSNAYDDGEIGDSHLGWISNASNKIRSKEVSLDGIVKLSDTDAVFKKQKIEGICVESETKNELVIHLVSDNDSGDSRLFKLKLNLND